MRLRQGGGNNSKWAHQALTRTVVEQANEAAVAALNDDYAALGNRLARQGIDIESITAKAMAFGVAIPSWGVGTGGTRFARFPGPGEPRGIFDKLDDCAVIQQLSGATPRVSLHIPWDKRDDRRASQLCGGARGLGFDAMNSNTFSGRSRTRRSPTSSAASATPTRRRASRRSSTISNASRSAGRSAPRR